MKSAAAYRGAVELRGVAAPGVGAGRRLRELPLMEPAAAAGRGRGRGRGRGLRCLVGDRLQERVKVAGDLCVFVVFLLSNSSNPIAIDLIHSALDRRLGWPPHTFPYCGSGFADVWVVAARRPGARGVQIMTLITAAFTTSLSHDSKKIIDWNY